MEDALRKYQLRLEESQKEALKIRKNYQKWLSKKKKELKRAVEKLEKVKPLKTLTRLSLRSSKPTGAPTFRLLNAPLRASRTLKTSESAFPNWEKSILITESTS